MSVNIEYSGQGARMTLSGELTIYSVTQIKSALAEAMGRASEVEVDLEGVTEIDTAGLQLMLIVKRHPGSAVRFVNHPSAVLRLVDFVNLGSSLGDPLFIAASPS